MTPEETSELIASMGSTSAQDDATDRLLKRLLQFLDDASQEEAVSNETELGISIGAVESMTQDLEHLDRANLEQIARAALFLTQSSDREAIDAAEPTDTRFTLNQAEVDQDIDLIERAMQSVEQPSQVGLMENQAEDTTNLHVLADAALAMEQSSQGEATANNTNDKGKAKAAEAQANPYSHLWSTDENRHLIILCTYTKATMTDITAALNRRFGLSLSEEQVVYRWQEMNEEGFPLCKIVPEDITSDEHKIITSERLIFSQADS